jgi:hypothetical protein
MLSRFTLRLFLIQRDLLKEMLLKKLRIQMTLTMMMKMLAKRKITKLPKMPVGSFSVTPKKIEMNFLAKSMLTATISK